MGSIILESEYFKFPNVVSYVQIDSIKKSHKHIIDALSASQPGDLLLIRTPGFGFELGRKLTHNIYDHIAVVLDNGNTLNIVNPKTIILPIMFFAKPNRRPLLLRPKWQNSQQRQKFIEEMKKFADGSYNLQKTLLGIIFTVLYTWLGIKIPMKKLDSSASRWICTEAILTSLLIAFPDFQKINNIKLDYHSLGFATTNDFLRICKHHSDLLEVVKLRSRGGFSP